jgi:hypothetical protein
MSSQIEIRLLKCLSVCSVGKDVCRIERWDVRQICTVGKNICQIGKLGCL